ncbi:MAG: thioredoxin domain-containing protein [Chitinophagaceae bacterium]|nr:thioredoxin domain-containing protein [Chitinophagaceae bacterium]
MQHTNRLAKENSPYLLQHAHNPVDWYPWGDEALQRAKAEDKPILVSIGYSSCHWCHVMERESFEDESTAAIMNQHFVNIKIDREERPDLDHVYMDALQAMTGSGGWPLNIFLTPELKPFYGGTYFPPVKAHNRGSWKDVLSGVSTAFNERRSEIEAQANELLAHLENTNSFGIEKGISIGIPVEELFLQRHADEMFANIMQTADKEWGGFGRAPKFPQTFTIRYLLQYYHFTGNKEALEQACLSLDKMIEGGIYDHVGGGFARYSTDTEWLAPHFEKMLYDNALIVMALSEAYQLTKKELYKKTIIETLQFVENEMTSPENGFYSALDADSEGVEGKYYTWTKSEVDAILKNDADLFCRYYDITDHGNWEEVNIPRTKKAAEVFCTENGLDAVAFEAKMKNCLQQLLIERGKKIRPLLDDKIILSWNALMNTAYSKAFAALGIEEYRTKAVSNMSFLVKAFQNKSEAGLLHVYKEGEAKFPGFLDDYAFLIQALIHLQEITSDTGYLEKAKELTEYVLKYFIDEESGYFFFTPEGQEDIIIRKKEVYDGAVPSGNSVLAFNLNYLGIIYDEANWKQQAIKMLSGLQQAIVRYPGSFGVWAAEVQNFIKGNNELAIIGKDYQTGRDLLLSHYSPNLVIQAAAESNRNFPLLKEKTTEYDETMFYLCRQYVCLTPTPNPLIIQDLLSEMTYYTIK